MSLGSMGDLSRRASSLRVPVGRHLVVGEFIHVHLVDQDGPADEINPQFETALARHVVAEGVTISAEISNDADRDSPEKLIDRFTLTRIRKACQDRLFPVKSSWSQKQLPQRHIDAALRILILQRAIGVRNPVLRQKVHRLIQFEFAQLYLM